MAKYTMEMVLEYAKVFEQNADKGDAESSQKWLRELAKKGGQASVNAYFTDQEQIDTLVGEGFERMALNPNTGQEVDRIKTSDSGFGIGQYLQLKRAISDIKEVKDRKTGQFVEVEFGGLPTVVDLTQGKENKRLWDFETDGPLGNGTRALVQFEVYNGRTVRLMNIGVLEHVAYEEGAVNEDDELFKVA